jgi:hypothetical protein
MPVEVSAPYTDEDKAFAALFGIVGDTGDLCVLIQRRYIELSIVAA